MSVICSSSTSWLFVCLVVFSGDGETCRRGAGWPTADPGFGTGASRFAEQRGQNHPRRLGGDLATGPAALPASQWPSAQLSAQRQPAKLRERWVTNWLCWTLGLVNGPQSRELLTEARLIMLYGSQTGDSISSHFSHTHNTRQVALSRNENPDILTLLLLYIKSQGNFVWLQKVHMTPSSFFISILCALRLSCFHK